MARDYKAERERRTAAKSGGPTPPVAPIPPPGYAPPFTRQERIAAIAACLPYCGIPGSFDERVEIAARNAELLLARVRGQLR